MAIVLENNWINLLPGKDSDVWDWKEHLPYEEFQSSCVMSSFVSVIPLMGQPPLSNEAVFF